MDDGDLRVVEAMEKYGGGFVKKLAAAAMVADSVNLAIIKGAWPEYWDEYTRFAEKDLEDEGPEDSGR